MRGLVCLWWGLVLFWGGGGCVLGCRGARVGVGLDVVGGCLVGLLAWAFGLVGCRLARGWQAVGCDVIDISGVWRLSLVGALRGAGVAIVLGVVDKVRHGEEAALGVAGGLRLGDDR